MSAGQWRVNDGPWIPWNATPAESDRIDPMGMAKLVAAGSGVWIQPTRRRRMVAWLRSKTRR